MSLNRWVGWLVLTVLAITTSGWLYNLQEPSPTIAVNGLQVPDYTLKNFTTVRMDEHGQPQYRLTAPTMTHYLNRETELTAPDILFLNQGQPTWTVRAEQGQVSADGNQIWLLGHTTLQQQPPVNGFQIISRDLRIQQDTQYAETQAPTLILSPSGETQCVGMRVFMATKQVELLSQVRGYYVPH